MATTIYLPDGTKEVLHKNHVGAMYDLIERHMGYDMSSMVKECIDAQQETIEQISEYHDDWAKAIDEITTKIDCGTLNDVPYEVEKALHKIRKEIDEVKLDG